FFRFDNQELYFMRHAPEEFVQMGANDAGVDHGYAELPVNEFAGFGLEIGVARQSRVFEFLEPVTIDVRLTNTSPYPRLVDEQILDGHSFEVIITSRHSPARRWRPFAWGCSFGATRVLQ